MIAGPEAASQPDSAARIRAEGRRLMLQSAAILILLFAIVGGWAAFAQIYGAVVAAGAMKIEANVKLVQPAEGGVVRRVFVREGALVALGDPIMELEDADANMALVTLRDQLDAEFAKVARLAAEIANSARMGFPLELSDRKADPAVQAVFRHEENLFTARLRVFREQAERLREQRTAIMAEIASLGRQVEAADKSLAYIREQEKMNESLHAQNFVASTRLLDAKRASSEKQEKKFEFESLRAQAQQRLADISLRLESLSANRLTEASKEDVDARTRIANLRERMKPAQDALERRIVRSPVSGTVHTLRAHTQGGVVGARDTVAEIAPGSPRLVAEVRLDPSDIDDVRMGQGVQLELSGLNRRATPLLSGTVSFVSPDLTSDPSNPSIKFFVVRVDLIGDLPAKVPITSGMPVAAYIQTRMRSPLELWLDPLIGGLRRSLRET